MAKKAKTKKKTEKKKGYSIFENKELAATITAMAADGASADIIYKSLKELYDEVPHEKTIQAFINNYMSLTDKSLVTEAKKRADMIESMKDETREVLIDNRVSAIEYYREMIVHLENIMVSLRNNGLGTETGNWEETFIKYAKEVREYRKRLDQLEGVDNTDQMKRIIVAVHKIAVDLFLPYVDKKDQEKLAEDFIIKVKEYAAQIGL
mgnify:CR=1 FL=1